MLLALLVQEILEADVVPVKCRGVGAPALPDAGVAVGRPDVPGSGRLVVDDVDALHVLRRESPSRGAAGSR